MRPRGGEPRVATPLGGRGAEALDSSGPVEGEHRAPSVRIGGALVGRHHLVVQPVAVGGARVGERGVPDLEAMGLASPARWPERARFRRHR
jgi:hypothetical protein